MTQPAHTLKFVLCSLLLSLSAHGQNWNPVTTTAAIWNSMAGSQHGRQLVSADFSDDPYISFLPGQIYASTNGGLTWQPTSAPRNYWESVAAATNGLRLVAAAEYDSGFNPGQIFISTNGSLTWTAISALTNYWVAVGSSADGQILVGAAYNDGIYVSTNFGINWSQSDAPTNGWGTLAVSADGHKMYATESVQSTYSGSGSGGIFISTNLGSTWNLSTSAPLFAWGPVVCSADGNLAFAGIAGNDGGSIYITTNNGETWDPTAAPTKNWQGLSMSTYGDILLACTYSGDNTIGLIYLSTDGGTTWTPQTAPASSWGCVFCSADGTLLTGGQSDGAIYTATNPVPQPKLAIKELSGHAVVSWPEYPAAFELQTRPTLNPGDNWTNMAGSVVLSGTNYYTTNSATSPGAFFRLVRP